MSSSGSTAARRGAAPKGYKKSDQRLTEDLGELLMNHGIDCSSVDLQVKEGIVTLTGECSDRSDKHQIEHLAAEMSGVKDVENQLRITKRGSQLESKDSTSSSKTDPKTDSSSPATTGIASAATRGVTETSATKKY